MSGPRREIEEQIKSLPPKFSVDEIEQLYEALIIDIVHMKRQNKPQQYIERTLHNKHKKLSFGLPGLFFKIVRGELDQNMFRTTMNIKRAVDEGKITADQAKNAIVDAAKLQIDDPNRKKRVPQAGETTQETTMMAKLGEEEEK